MQRQHQHKYNFISTIPSFTTYGAVLATQVSDHLLTTLLLPLIDKRRTAAMRKSHQAIAGSQGKWGHYLPLPDHTCELPSLRSKGTKTSFG